MTSRLRRRWRPYQPENAFPPYRPAKSRPAGDRSAAWGFKALGLGPVPHHSARPAGRSVPRWRWPAGCYEWASLPRWYRFRNLFNPAQNSAAHRTKNGRVAEQTRAPIRPHRERLNLERKLVSVGRLQDFACGLRVARGLLQIPEPLSHEPYNLFAHPAGPIVEFKGCCGKKTAAGKHPLLTVCQPVLAESAEPLQALKLIGGTHHPLDKDLTGFVDHCALQVFLRPEVCE